MSPSLQDLRPLPYHREVVAYLKEEERALWDWYASSKARQDHVEGLKTALLKSCYRLDEAAHPAASAAARTALERLGMSGPITLYQAQDRSESNASLCFVPGEIHVVFSGALLGLLVPEELVAILGHELSHHRLYQEDGGDLLVAQRLISAIGGHPAAATAHVECARRYALVTELYADRGGLLACGSLPVAVAALVKSQTGIATVRGDSYLAQAREVFERAPDSASAGETHPECFLRARALELWSARGNDVDRDVERLLAQAKGVTTLDLVAQRAWTRITRRLVADLLRPAPFRTDVTLAHARHFFPDLEPAREEDPALDADLRAMGEGAAEYLAYLLLDFAAVDPDLTDEALPHALLRGRRLGIGEKLETIARKELAIRAPKWRAVLRRAEELSAGGVP